MLVDPEEMRVGRLSLRSGLMVVERDGDAAVEPLPIAAVHLEVACPEPALEACWVLAVVYRLRCL